MISGNHVGKIRRVALREVWKHEAYDFTTWLQANIEIVGDVIGVELSAPEREKTAGAFSIDLVAEDRHGNVVVIENQLERSNHDHLGKLITYLVAMEAKTAIWLVSDPRPEHVAAITWLNESSSANFYLLKLEAIRIDESPPAPLVTLIVGPSEEGKEVGRTKQERAELHMVYRKFWTGVLDLARTKTRLHSGLSPAQQNWLSTGSGISGVAFNYVITQDQGRVELYIDRGKEKADENLAILRALESEREAIEHDFGSELKWLPLEGMRACLIRKVVSESGYRSDESEWPGIQQAMVEAMVRFEMVLAPRIRKLNI